MRPIMLFAIATSITMASCASAPSRGTVFDHQTDGRLVKIHMDHNEMKLNDGVIFTERNCEMPVRGKTNNCTVKQVASGKVVQILDEHDSLVELAGTEPLPKGAQASRVDEKSEPTHKH